MSSDDQPPMIRQRRRRALDTTEEVRSAPVVLETFDPGPMVNYPPLPTGPDGLPVSPAIKQRIRDLRQLDIKAAQEFILRTLHTFLIAHRPIDEIARTFGVTTRRVYQWRNELYARIGQELRTKTPTDLIGKQIAHYETVKATAWRELYRTNDHADKARYLNTAMTAERNISDLYAKVGMIAETTMKPVIDITAEDEDGKAGTLQKLATDFLTGAVAVKKKPVTVPKTVEQDIATPIDESDYLL